MQYINELASSGREDEIPRYVVVSSFARMVLYDLKQEEDKDGGFEFPLENLHKHIKHPSVPLAEFRAFCFEFEPAYQ